MIKRFFQSTRGRRYLLALFLSLLAMQFVRSNVGTFSIVEGLSMYPTFRPNDVVQAKTLFAEVQRGDVVIVADNEGDEVIKRVIGLPGETITLYRGFVYVDQRRLIEPYLPKYTYTFKRNQRNELPETWHLATDRYFVLGDNRPYSADSRQFGPVARLQIHRVVTSPPNATKPALSDIVLTADGQVLPGKHSQPHHSAATTKNSPGPTPGT